MKLKSKIMMGMLAAFVASVHAETLDLAGVDKEVKNVSELAAYDEVTVDPMSRDLPAQKREEARALLLELHKKECSK